MLNLMPDKNKGKYRGGTREDACDHGLSRRSLRVNLSRVELESESDDSKQQSVNSKKYGAEKKEKKEKSRPRKLKARNNESNNRQLRILDVRSFPPGPTPSSHQGQKSPLHAIIFSFCVLASCMSQHRIAFSLL